VRPSCKHKKRRKFFFPQKKRQKKSLCRFSLTKERETKRAFTYAPPGSRPLFYSAANKLLLLHMLHFVRKRRRPRHLFSLVSLARSHY
jgi:hypothetical protein